MIISAAPILGVAKPVDVFDGVDYALGDETSKELPQPTTQVVGFPM